MSKFDILTKYMLTIQSDSIGEWVIDKENDKHQRCARKGWFEEATKKAFAKFTSTNMRC